MRAPPPEGPQALPAGVLSAGMGSIPEGAGLGIEFDEDKVRYYSSENK